MAWNDDSIVWADTQQQKIMLLSPKNTYKIIHYVNFRGVYYYCISSFDQPTQEAALATELVPDPSRPTHKGCGPFPWSALTLIEFLSPPPSPLAPPPPSLVSCDGTPRPDCLVQIKIETCLQPEFVGHNCLIISRSFFLASLPVYCVDQWHNVLQGTQCFH